MPGYLKSSLSLPQARETTLLRFPERDTTVLNEEIQPRFCSIKLTFLYASPPPGRKVSVVKNQRGNLQKTRLLEIERYHRFFLFGNKENEEIFAMFSSTSVETQNLLKSNVKT